MPEKKSGKCKQRQRELQQKHLKMQKKIPVHICMCISIKWWTILPKNNVTIYLIIITIHTRITACCFNFENATLEIAFEYFYSNHWKTTLDYRWIFWHKPLICHVATLNCLIVSNMSNKEKRHEVVCPISVTI